MSSSRSSTAAAASSTRATGYSSSSAMVSPAVPCLRPSWARSSAPGMRSSSSATLLASGSASSSAPERSERATVPGCRCMRPASRESFSACLSSRVMLSRSTIISIHETARIVYAIVAGWSHRRPAPAIRSTNVPMREGGDPGGRFRLAPQRGDGGASQADGGDRRQPDALARHEDLCRARHRGLRDLPRLQGLPDQGVLRQLLPAHVRRVLRPREREHGGAPFRNGALARNARGHRRVHDDRDRKSTRLNSSHANISYAVFCLKKKKYTIENHTEASAVPVHTSGTRATESE